MIAVSTLFVIQLLLYYHGVSAGSCRAIYGERFRCISPDACAQKNRVWKTRCGPKANGVCCQVMDENHRNFKRCGMRVQRHAVHRHHPYGSSLKHVQPSRESMSDSENLDVPWVILANKDSNVEENRFRNDYIALSNSKPWFYKSRKNSKNQEKNNEHGENTNDDRYIEKNYMENSNTSSGNSTIKIEATDKIVKVSTKYNIQLNDTLYNNGENIKMTSVDLLQSTNSCGKIGCSTNIIKTVVNDVVTEASNETSNKLKGSEEIYFKNYEISTNNQISITENDTTISSKDMNQFKDETSFNVTFETVPISTEAVTNTIVNQNSEEGLKNSVRQEGTLNNSFDIITTYEEQLNSANDEYNDNETMKQMENATKLQDEASFATESEEKGKLDDDSELVKPFFSENTVVAENENISTQISESEQKTNSESLVEVTNGNYSRQVSKSEETINTQNTFDLSNENFTKLMPEYEETTNVQQTHYKEEFESTKKTILYDSSEVVTENSTQKKTIAVENEISDTIFTEETENISKPYSEYKKKAISETSVEMLNESTLIHEFETKEAIIAHNSTKLLNENSSILVSESEETTNVQETAESTNVSYNKEEHELKENINLESSIEIATESILEESTKPRADYFSDATIDKEQEESISKSDSETKGMTTSNISIEMANQNAFSQESKSEETIDTENTFELLKESALKFFSKSEDTTTMEETAESRNETHYEEELEKKTNLYYSSEIVTESSSEERTTPGEKDFSETTVEAENISKSDSEAKEKTTSNISIEMANQNSFSQESKSEETTDTENTSELLNENALKFFSKSEDATTMAETAESRNETHYEEELEKKTNLYYSSEIVTESSSEERATPGKKEFSETTVEAENISKSDSEAKEKTISNIFTEMTNQNSFSQESKSEEIIDTDNTSEFLNENAFKFLSKSEDTTTVTETAESTNETNYKEELEKKINLNGSSDVVTEISLEETAMPGEKDFSEIIVEAENISKLESESEKKPITEISEIISESKQITNAQETFELLNKTNFEEHANLEEKANLESSVELVTESSLNEMTISEGKIYETTVDVVKENISKPIFEPEGNTKNSVEVSTENSLNHELKSKNTSNVEINIEFQNENSSIIEYESKGTTNVQETSELSKQTYFDGDTKLEIKTNLEDSSKFVTEISLKESTISEEDIFHATTNKALKKSNSKIDSVSEEMTNSENFEESSSNRESKLVESISTQAAFELSNKNFTKFVSESKEHSKVSENSAFTNVTHYKDELELNDNKNLEGNSEVVTENSLKESTTSKKDILSEPTDEAEKEKLTETNSESKIKTTSQISVEMKNIDSLSHESKSGKPINTEITFELNEEYSKVMPKSEETTNVKKDAEFLNETNYEEEVKSEKKTKLEGSNKLMSESFLEERTISRDEDIFETTVEVEKEYVTKPDSKFDEETISDRFVEITNENFSVQKLKSEEKKNTYNSFELQNGSTSKLEFQETTNVQENVKLTNESKMNLEGSNKLTNVSSVEEIKVEEENFKTSIEMLEFEEESTSEGLVKVSSGHSSSNESESEETIYAQNKMELPNEGSSKLMSETKETPKVQESAESTNETHYNEQLELRKKTNYLNSSEHTTEIYLKQSTLSDEDFSEIRNEAETKNTSTEVSEIEQKTNIESFVEVKNDNSSGQMTKSEVTINSQNAFELPIEGSSSEFISEEATSIEETVVFTNEEKTNLDVTKLVNESSSEIEVKSTDKVTNEKYDLEVSEVEGETTKAYTVEINNEITSEEINAYEEMVNQESTVVSAGEKSYIEVSATEETTNREISMDEVNENTGKKISKLLLESSPGISAEVENEEYPNDTSEIEETVNPLNNSESAFEGSPKKLSNHTEMSNLESKIELTTGNFYKESTEYKGESNPMKSSDLVNESTKREVLKISTDASVEISTDASMKSAGEMTNENLFTSKFETEELINPLNISEVPFKGYPKYLSNHTEVTNLVSKIELTTRNFNKESTESNEKTNQITSFDLKHESTKIEISDILVDTSTKTTREMTNKNTSTDKYESDEMINPLNNFETTFEGYQKYLSNHTEVTNLNSKTELKNVDPYKKSTESEEETYPMTASDLTNESTKKEVPETLVNTSMNIAGENVNENISTDKFESEKTPNSVNNSELGFEGYSKNVFERTKSTNVESNIELRKENSYTNISESVQETNPHKSILNETTRHLMIEDEVLGKSYGTTTEEEIRLSNTAIKFYDGRENIHPSYTNKKEFHKSHTEISEYSTSNTKILDTQIVTSSSNKTSKTVTEENKKSKSSEILTKALTRVTRTEIALEGDEENVTINDLGNLITNSSKEIHESLDNNTNITKDKLLTEVSIENALNVNDSFGFTTKYPNQFSNTESQIYKSNDITTSQDFVVNENFSTFKETSEYLENARDKFESITEDEIQFSNTEINFQQKSNEANFTLKDIAKTEGVEFEMNSSPSYASFSEALTNEIVTNVSNENTRRITEEYDNLDEKTADITTKNEKKFSNDEINFHENEEKMTESIFFDTFITDINETSTESGEGLSKYFDISTENKIQISNSDIHLYENVQNTSIHKAFDIQDVKNVDKTESNNKNVSFLTSDDDFHEISDDFAKDGKIENGNFVATTKSQFHFNNTENEFYDRKEITSKDTDFYERELKFKITTEFENINSLKNMSDHNKNVPENVTSPVFIDDSVGKFSHVIDGSKNSNKNFVITTENQFHFNRTDTVLYENEESTSRREVVEFENSSANVEISEHETNNIKMIKNSTVDLDNDNNNTEKEIETKLLNSSEDIDKGILLKTEYTMGSLNHDFTTNYNTYSTFIEKKYHTYPEETHQQFMMETTTLPTKPDHTNHLNDYKHDMHKVNTYHKGNTKLQPLENIYKYYDYGGQSFNNIHQAARDEYHKAHFLTNMLENQPALVQKFQHPMFYQNPNFMNERPMNFQGSYYVNNVLQPYVESYPYLYDQFNVNYPFSQFYQVGLYKQPLFSHNMAIPLSNYYRPYYGSEKYYPSVQSYPSIYNKGDLGNMYPNQAVDFSTFHQAGFYRQPNPIYMIANPSLRRYRRSYGSESLQHSVLSNPSILKAYSLKKTQGNQSTDLPKYHQVGLQRQLNPTYDTTESLLNKDNVYFRAYFKYYHPFFVKRYLNMLEPFEGERQLDEFPNKENGIIRGKPLLSHFGTKHDPLNKQHTKKRKHYTKSKLINENRRLNSMIKRRGIESHAFTGNSNKFSDHKKDTLDMGRTEEPFRQAYREFIDKYNLLHVIEYLPPEKTYRKRIFNNETLDITENKSIKQQTAHYTILDKIFSTSTDYYKVPAGEKYFTTEYTVRKNEKYLKDQSAGDKLIEKSKNKGKRQKEDLKPIKRNLNSVLVSEKQNTSQGINNSNSYEEITLSSDLQANVTLSNDLDTVLNVVESFPVRPEVQKTNVRRSNVPGISHREANLQEGRTIGGKLEYENWPWIVSIYKLPDMFHVCSGVLIDERHILTAAHCFLGHDFVEYVASVGSLMKISDPNQGYLVEDMIIHTDFKRNCYCNDIALLRLKDPVDDHLTPICLSAIDTAVVGENTTLLGWGDVKFMAGRGMSSTDRLQRLNNLPITSSEECRKIYSRILHRNLSTNFSESYVCAGVPDGSKDACVGDSGGPLLHRSYDGSWTLLGIVSFGYKCGAPGVPGIYTRVSYYLQWIYGAIDDFYASHINDKPHSN